MERVSAELILQSHAAEIRKHALARGVAMSPEQALVKALDDPDNRHLVKMLD